MRKTVIVLASLCILSATLAAWPQGAQTSFTGRWEGTMKLKAPNGQEGPPIQILFNLTQKGEELTGTAGMPEQQIAIAQGAVANGTATFQVDTGVGLNKFSLTILEGRLRGEMRGEREGMGGLSATIDAALVK